MARHLAFACMAWAILSQPAFAQAPAVDKKGCESAPTAQAPTPSEQGPKSGTKPGNPGSSGWTGGMGGSHSDTTPSGPAPGSGQYQPPVARGLDLKQPDPSTRC